jgi:RNA polymerase sigma-70 factor (ECF subfamily)
MSSQRRKDAVIPDDDAAAVAFERFSGRVYRFLLAKSRNHHDAEDLTQRVFLNATEALRRRRVEPNSMLAWLYTIASRRFVDEVRRRELAKGVGVLAPAPEADDGYGRQVASSLRQAIERLPRDQQVILVMKVIQGRPYAEIAVELDLTVEACRMRLSRAVAALRLELEREGYGPAES